MSVVSRFYMKRNTLIQSDSCCWVSVDIVALTFLQLHNVTFMPTHLYFDWESASVPMMWWGTKKQQFTLEPIRATLHHRLYVTVMNAPQDCVEHVLISNTQSNPPPPPQLIINHWHIWEQWLISLLNKRQNQSLYSSEPLHFFSCCARTANPVKLTSRQQRGVRVCVCAFLCVRQWE